MVFTNQPKAESYKASTILLCSQIPWSGIGAEYGRHGPAWELCWENSSDGECDSKAKGLKSSEVFAHIFGAWAVMT